MRVEKRELEGVEESRRALRERQREKAGVVLYRMPGSSTAYTQPGGEK